FAPGAFLVERPQLRQRLWGIVNAEFVFDLCGPSNFASRFAVEACERLAFASVLLDDEIWRLSRIIKEIGKRIERPGIFEGGNVLEHPVVRMGKTEEDISLRTRPIHQLGQCMLRNFSSVQ